MTEISGAGIMSKTTNRFRLSNIDKNNLLCYVVQYFRIDIKHSCFNR